MSDLPRGIFRRGGVLWIRYAAPDHSEVRESAETADVKTAIRFRQKRVREALNARDGIAKFSGPARDKQTVDETLDALLASYEVRKLRSLRQVRVHVKPLRMFFGSCRVSSVTAARLAAFIGWRRSWSKEDGRKPVGDSTIDREIEILRCAFRLAEIANAPKFPKLCKDGSNARRGFYTREEFDKLLRELPTQILRDLAILGYGTGARRGELLALRWTGFDKDAKTLSLHASETKSGKARTLALAGWPELLEAVERRRAERMPGCPLIFHVGGKPLGQTAQAWSRAAVRAGLPGRTFHDLRRTAVRAMVRSGVPQSVAMRISGHVTDRVFRRYDITDERDLASAMEKRAAFEALSKK